MCHASYTNPRTRCVRRRRFANVDPSLIQVCYGMEIKRATSCFESISRQQLFRMYDTLSMISKNRSEHSNTVNSPSCVQHAHHCRTSQQSALFTQRNCGSPREIRLFLTLQSMSSQKATWGSRLSTLLDIAPFALNNRAAKIWLQFETGTVNAASQTPADGYTLPGRATH